MTSRQWLEDPIMSKIKRAAMQRGNNGIREFTQDFRRMDKNGNSTLSAVELKEGLLGWGVTLTDKEVQYIMVAFDKDGDKQLSLAEFLGGLRLAMNPRRKNIVRKAFQALDVDGSGQVDINELRARYSTATHPAVLSGEKSEAQVARDFLENFDDATNPDGLISQEEFDAFYAGLSQNVENDDYFEMMVMEAFQLNDTARPRFAPNGTPEYDPHGLPTHPEHPVAAAEVYATRARPLNDRDYDTDHMKGGRAPEPQTRNKYLPHTWETTQRADFGFYQKEARQLAEPPKLVNIPDEEALASTGDPVLDRIRNKILKRGGKRGFRGLSRVLRIMDDNGNHKLSPSEVKEGLQVYQLSVTAQELEVVFQFFDRDGDGSISVTEFVRGVRGPMKRARVELVKLAFSRLDRDGSGRVPFSELAEIYDVYKHPAVMAKESTPEEVMQEFIEDWDRNCDGTITLEEFIDYYGDLSAGIDSDTYFELMIRNAWHISGGVGQAQNTSCRRVLVTFASGKQEVKEIKNDLGIRADDIPAMMKNLMKQGITGIKRIELHH